ncbi:hypothetical protein NDU88_008092 [Pleurodeles waltl]|uniref:Uncharacterized protein n=1 Tax=Pleurodeles waltl TaxID=8319 RepID=A0AAV7VSN1_PLEWA|nr:hypothetical protein NDU88_008092 [Pleurodeles waltl]
MTPEPTPEPTPRRQRCFSPKLTARIMMPCKCKWIIAGAQPDYHKAISHRMADCKRTFSTAVLHARQDFLFTSRALVPPS